MLKTILEFCSIAMVVLWGWYYIGVCLINHVRRNKAQKVIYKSKKFINFVMNDCSMRGRFVNSCVYEVKEDIVLQIPKVFGRPLCRVTNKVSVGMAFVFSAVAAVVYAVISAFNVSMFVLDGFGPKLLVFGGLYMYCFFRTVGVINGLKAVKQYTNQLAELCTIESLNEIIANGREQCNNHEGLIKIDILLQNSGGVRF